MSNLTPLHHRRVWAGNPNHHLWNNHGTWFVHYTIHPTHITKQRVRRSLGTKNLELARTRRDRFFEQMLLKESLEKVLLVDTRNQATFLAPDKVKQTGNPLVRLLA